MRTLCEWLSRSSNCTNCMAFLGSATSRLHNKKDFAIWNRIIIIQKTAGAWDNLHEVTTFIKWQVHFGLICAWNARHSRIFPLGLPRMQKVQPRWEWTSAEFCDGAVFQSTPFEFHHESYDFSCMIAVLLNLSLFLGARGSSEETSRFNGLMSPSATVELGHHQLVKRSFGMVMLISSLKLGHHWSLASCGSICRRNYLFSADAELERKQQDRIWTLAFEEWIFHLEQLSTTWKFVAVTWCCSVSTW